MPPIVSCFANSYGRFGTQGAIENLRDAGIEYLELPIRTAGVPTFFGDTPLLTDESGPDDVAAVEKLLSKHDVRVSSCNITSGNPLERQVVDITLKKLAIAERFGVPLVVAGAGEVEHEDQLETLYSHLREIGDAAAKRGITYCFETHPGICCDHRKMLKTMADLDHPHLKLNFDTGNIFYYNEHIECEIALSKVCHHVKHIHLKDTSGEYRQWYFPAIGHGGAVDFFGVLQLMRTIGFQGPYSLEIEGVAEKEELSLEEYQQRIVDSVKHLKTCGYFDQPTT